ncbi:MAG: RNA polymerase sigma factor [Candidatus Kapabacteria bacterium]|jgi:RNA polymerase sigma factor (sigma-70 family)|nr:RNA polymerase sigma factor [Candidatus Kapabacteria bacterium]
MTSFITNLQDNALDTELVQRSLDGDRKALEHLIKRHQAFIYNVSLKLVLYPQDAEDITQDVLIKVITHLSSFHGQSSFRTWLYRIVMNHFLDMKKRRAEDMTSLSRFANDGEALLQVNVTDEDALSEEQIAETQVMCTVGMLMCLSREQRLVYVLGDVFSIDHNTASELLSTTPEAYRQQLTRARKDLYSFIQQKCGLVNPNNPCRCIKKTKLWIERGLVAKDTLLFKEQYTETVREHVEANITKGALIVKDVYSDLYSSHPMLNPKSTETLVEKILGNQDLMRLLRLNEERKQ